MAIQHKRGGKASGLRTLGVDDLTITDAVDWARAGLGGLLDTLIEALRLGRVRFLLPRRPLSWDRTAFLNLTYWTPGGGELLASREVTADQIAHVAWHHLIARRVGRSSVHALLLAEAIASAFDAYVMGMLLRRTPRAAFLRSQVPIMSERAAAAGLSEAGFARILGRFAGEPERAFEDLRALLYDAARALYPVDTVPAAAGLVARFDRHQLAPLLHHYELSNWILHARARARARPSPRASALDAALRSSAAPLTTLLRLLRTASA